MSVHVSTHRMVRITLMNWYLFGYEDIEVDASSVMISGANGAGKSSIIDAIQTVLSGGNENALSMNAQSSNTQKSSRTIQTYALGVVDDQDSGGGLAACRSESNTYVALTFRRPDGSHYALGMGFYARAGDSKVAKLWFAMDDNSLSSVDFMDGSRVVTLSDFQRRLKAMDPGVMFAKNAKSFRLDYCQLMSQEGAGFQISPDPVWRAIKNGIAYRGEKRISDFISNYILPAEDLDINRLHNDYLEHERILELIKKTEQEISALSDLLKHYRRYEARMVDSVCYQWVAAEASLMAYDMRIEQAIEELDTLSKTLTSLKNSEEEMVRQEPEIIRRRDEARDLYKNSAASQAIEKYEQAINLAKTRIENAESQLTTAKQSLAEFLNKRCPAGVTSELRDAFQHCHLQLEEAVALTEDPMIPWPANKEQAPKILDAIEAFHSIHPKLSEERDRVNESLTAAARDLQELQLAIQKFESGDVLLSSPTNAVIELLEKEGIKVAPVCELCSINDSYWQKGIEHYLGRNREALVIQQGDYTQALKRFRQAVKQGGDRMSLRGVRLVNPDYDFGFRGTPIPHSAAALIESDIPVALRYLQGLLWSVNLVETEEELRKEKRAITPDGMVAANGSVSGGNDIKGILIGMEARRRYASTMKKQLNEATRLYREQRLVFNPINEFNTTFLSNLEKVKNSSSPLSTAFSSLQAAQAEVQEQNRLIMEIRNNADTSLEVAFTQANKILSDFNKEKTELAVNKSQLEEKIKAIETQLPQVKEMVKQNATRRDLLEGHSIIDQDRANSQLEKLIDNESDSIAKAQYDCTIDQEIAINDAVAQTARDRAEKAEKNAKSAGDEALKGKVDFMARFEPANRETLRDLDPHESKNAFEAHLAHLEGTELVTHRYDAEKACDGMLTTFRADVVSTIQDAFQRMERTFKLLNDQLKHLPFNNNIYRFVYPVVETKVLKDVHDYVKAQSKADTDAVNSLFDFNQDHPAIAVIQEVLTEGRVDELSDYRNFFTYDIVSTDQSTGKERRFSNLLRSGSGGEQQSPFYVAFGASFMTAFKVQRRGDEVHAGAAIALFDEAFSRMDGNNTFAALEFFTQIGLQAFLAAPLDAEVKMGHHVERVVTIIRDGLSVFTDSRQIHDAGWELFESDNPKRHPELIEGLIPQAKKQLSTKPVTMMDDKFE